MPPTRKHHGRLIIVACTLLWTVPLSPLVVRADDTLRCGSRLVSVGDGKDKVRALCGDPTDVAFAGTIGRRGYPNTGQYDYSYFGPAWVEMPVEIWTYNLGSHKLLRKLRFIGDELVEISTAGYGY